MICTGSAKDKTWPDNWTSTTVDGGLSAQFGELSWSGMNDSLMLTQSSEHTLLVTEDGIEVLTARLPNSPGGKVELPKPAENGTETPAA